MKFSVLEKALFVKYLILTVYLYMNVVVGVSLPQEMVAKVDGDRGDVPRSKFLQRLVEQAYARREEKTEAVA